MYKQRLFYILCSFILLSCSAGAQNEEPQKVLFVGNSYVYFWNLPQAVALMADAKDINMVTRSSTVGGATLGHHWRSERGATSRTAIEDGNYDAVILQDHSMRAIKAPDSLIHYGKLFGDLIKSKGAQPYVYQTWSRKNTPETQKVISSKYQELAERINARIIPVGDAWQRAIELDPEIELYDEDGSHPSLTGTYLSACVFFGILTGASPVGLPARLITTDKNGEKLFISLQSKKQAQFCQEVALEVISNVPD